MRPRTILIIGMGAGDPDHMTIQAVKALARAHVAFIPDKGAEKADLREIRLDICRRHASPSCRLVDFAVPRRRTQGTYREEVEAWHARSAALYAELMHRELEEGDTGAFLVWGDPSLYDSTARVIEAVMARAEFALDYEVIPGISSVQALAARHRIPLNGIGEPVRITTGRRLARELAGHGGPGTVVVMLDGEQAFQGVDDGAMIYWGAYLGTPDEILVSGRLGDVRGEIEDLRAAARRRKGWIMDIYLLRVLGNG